MIVKHLDGRTEFLTDYKSLQRKRRVNGEYSLSFLLIKTERNEHAYPLSVEESIIEYDGQEYRIKKMTEKTIGNTPVKQIHADHVFFDLVDEFQYDTVSGTKTLDACLTHALQNTGYTFDVIDSFPSVTFENFGNDNSLSLIQLCLNRFGAEIEIDGKHLTFKRQIGRNTDIQFRYKHNIKTLEKYVDTTNLSTYIKGFGKQNDNGSYVVTAEYLSPMHQVYGIRHAKPVYDERYTTKEGLDERLRQELQDKPNISIKLEAVELKKAGINTEQIELGDNVFIIYEPLNIDVNARIMEIIEYPEEHKSNEFTISNIQSNLTDAVADFQRTKDRVDGIFEGKEKLPYNVLPDAIRRATESLQSAETELVFENGILAVNPNNPNFLVIFNSNGIGISRDGGKTFTEAITADGFVLSAGAIGQLNANNINVAGVVSAINDDDTLVFEASKIDLYGKVTFNMFDTSTKSIINSKTDPTQVSNIISQTTIDGGKVKIVNNADFIKAKNNAEDAKNLTDLWRYGTTTEIDGGNIRTGTISAGKITVGKDTNFEAGYNPHTANQNANRALTAANNANNQVNLWKYPNTTLINGGSIYTNSIDTNKLKAGLLIGFTIRTDSNTNNAHIDMTKDELRIGNGSGQNVIRMQAGDDNNLIEPGIHFSHGGYYDVTEIRQFRDTFLITGDYLEFNAFEDMELYADTVYVTGNFSVGGSKNASVPTSIGHVNVSAYETAEYYFGDIGRGKVVNGKCKVEIESLFKETVNTDIDYEVFLTAYGPGQIYVAEMTPDYFVIKGDDIPFAYEIKAKRKGYETVRLELTQSEVEEIEN